jgi:hypothetical protein
VRDRRRGVLVVEGVFADPRAPSDPAVAAAIETLALFAGAGSVNYSGEAVHWLLDHHL